VPAPDVDPDAVRIVYFSNVSENTKRFVDRLGLPALRLPLTPSGPQPCVSDPYVLITPTYGGALGPTTRGGAHVPRQVVSFLNVEHNRNLCRGVISSGNTNFGTEFGIAGDIVARKLGVPLLYRFELMGTHEDVERVREGLEEFWQHRR